ncbi:hypothetical protein MRX96_036393 [Rhipicephalus microplus]
MPVLQVILVYYKDENVKGGDKHGAGEILLEHPGTAVDTWSHAGSDGENIIEGRHEQCQDTSSEGAWNSKRYSDRNSHQVLRSRQSSETSGLMFSPEETRDHKSMDEGHTSRVESGRRGGA